MVLNIVVGGAGNVVVLVVVVVVVCVQLLPCCCAKQMLVVQELMMTLGDKFSTAQVDEMLQYLDEEGVNKIDRHTFGKIFQSF